MSTTGRASLARDYDAQAKSYDEFPATDDDEFPATSLDLASCGLRVNYGHSTMHPATATNTFTAYATLMWVFGILPINSLARRRACSRATSRPGTYR